MKKKKWLTFLLTGTICFALSACGTKVDETSQSQIPEQKPSAQSEQADYGRTEGIWRLDGAMDTASIYMDGLGGFQTYYADGALEFDGHLEYVDEDEDGNGRYDLYDKSGEFLYGFYFDSDTELHIGNQGGQVYVLDTESLRAEPDDVPTPPALICSWRFTGQEPLESRNHYRGGYLYRDMTEDALTVITNACFLTDQKEEESQEAYMFRTAQETGGAEPQEFCWEESSDHSERITYPVYILSWQTGSNEDIRKGDGFFFMTDTHTYLFSFDTSADNHEEMKETWQEVFWEINLE